MLKQLFQKWRQKQPHGFESDALRSSQLDTLEEQLILADVGIDLAVRLVDALRDDATLQTPESIQQALIDACNRLMAKITIPTVTGKPHVVLMVGVNGAGKTTAIGKLAFQAKQQGKTVYIGAGDTFRAAAREQLAIWSDRAGATVVSHPTMDAAAVLFDTVKQAQNADLVLLDTAGRLQNQRNLMDELAKIRQVVGKALPGGAHFDAWLVLDATTGQNALNQLDLFNQAVGLTGIVLSKWDGSAKGGIVLALADRYQLPVVWMGTGEKLTDIMLFDPEQYLSKLLT